MTADREILAILQRDRQAEHAEWKEQQRRAWEQECAHAREAARPLSLRAWGGMPVSNTSRTAIYQQDNSSTLTSLMSAYYFGHPVWSPLQQAWVYR